MEAQFSLPYSEYQTIAMLSKVLPKREGYAFFVPVSRQQASVDLMILHARSGKTLRGQVKSSKHFDWSKSPTLRFWYPNFRRSYRPGAADVFFLLGTYPLLEEGKNVRHSHAHWQHLILVLSDPEMRNILEQTGRDRFF